MLARTPSWIWVPIVFIAILTTGFVALFRRRNTLDADMRFANEFRRRFIDYANSRGADREAYHWMIVNSNEMQLQMGYAGILANFRDPPFTYTNYPVILNMLPRIRRDLDDDLLRGMRTSDLLQMFDEVLLRYLGDLERALDQSVVECRKPTRWFFVGIEQTIAVPLYFLSSFGVLSVASVHALQRTRFFKLCSALIVLLGLVASIISVINDGKTAWGNLKSMIGI